MTDTLDKSGFAHSVSLVSHREESLGTANTRASGLCTRRLQGRRPRGSRQYPLQAGAGGHGTNRGSLQTCVGLSPSLPHSLTQCENTTSVPDGSFVGSLVRRLANDACLQKVSMHTRRRYCSLVSAHPTDKHFTLTLLSNKSPFPWSIVRFPFPLLK